ncbi:MAG: nuclear transport factor 2 family protein [Saonia sp.]
MKIFKTFVVALILFSFGPPLLQAQSEADYKDLDQTGKNIRDAFAKGDLETIKKYHHPDVIKALDPTKVLEGREVVLSNLEGTLNNFYLEFQKNELESMLINGDTAVEQTRFEIKGTPKVGGDSWIFKGRTMVVYVRYDKSPTGWASIREIIQVATE